MKIKHFIFALLASAAVVTACQKKEDELGVAKIEVSPSSLTFGSSASSQVLTLNATRDWTVTGAPDWIAFDPSGGAGSTKSQTVTVTVIGNEGFDRETDVTFTIGLSKAYVNISQSGSKGQVDYGQGTLEKPFTVDGVIAYINSLENPSTGSSDFVYITGKVSTISQSYTYNITGGNSYGNARFYISDDGGTSSSQFYCYNTMYMKNRKFTSSDTDIKEGDEVVICAKVCLYGSSNPVYETLSGSSYLYSLNGKTEGGPTPSSGTAKGSGTLADPYNPAGAAAYAESLGADVQSTNSVYIKGKISDVSTTFAASGSYGNATFTIVDSEDGTGSFYIFQTYYLGNRKWVSGDTDIEAGDEVIVYGPVVNFKGNTPETAGKGASYIYSLNGKTEDKEQETPDPTDISTIIASEDESAVAAENVYVGAVTTRGYVATDGKSHVYVYTANTPSVEIGDIVKFSGTKTTYYGLPEITSPTTTKTSSGTVTYPEPVDITSSFDNYSASEAVYVKYKATMYKNGNFTNFRVEGASLSGALSSAPNAYYEGISEGDEVEIYGYFNGINTTNNLLNVIAVKIENITTGKTIPGEGENQGGGGGKVDPNASSYTLDSSAIKAAHSSAWSYTSGEKKITATDGSAWIAYNTYATTGQPTVQMNKGKDAYILTPRAPTGKYVRKVTINTNRKNDGTGDPGDRPLDIQSEDGKTTLVSNTTSFASGLDISGSNSRVRILCNEANGGATYVVSVTIEYGE